MKFGVLISRNMIDRAAVEPYGKLYDYLREMEDLGYDMAYVGQHRFSATTAFGGDAPATEPAAPLVMLAALLARTERMRMCTNILLLAAHHPLEVAEQVNTLNELSNGRFVLGAGLGYQPHEFETVGIGFKTRARRFEEALEILRLGLSGGPFSFAGQHFQIPPCRVEPPPIPGPPTPLWIGAVSEPAMQRAARLGDGWLIGFAEHLQELVGKVERYRAMAAGHGRPATTCLMRDLHIAPTRAGLDPDWLPNVAQVWRSYADVGALPDRDEASREVMLEGRAMSLEEFAPNRAIVGDPDDCARELQRVKDLIAPDYLLFAPTGVPDPDQRRRELRLFAKTVMPAFRT